MLWRLLVTLVTIFWLIMTVLLVRVTYFPEGSQFAQLPPATVLKMFLDRGAAGKQLHLYHGEKKKVGHLTFDLRRTSSAQESPDYVLVLSGMMERGTLRDFTSSINWRLNIRLKEGRRWAGAEGQVRLPEDGVLLVFNWREESPTPEFTLHTKRMGEMNDAMLQPLLGQIHAGTAPGGAQEDFFTVTAREGVTPIAGQKRKSYLVEFKFDLMDRFRVSAVFTEEGDLALIEFPDGYRALEPYIHGLVPEAPE